MKILQNKNWQPVNGLLAFYDDHSKQCRLHRELRNGVTKGTCERDRKGYDRRIRKGATIEQLVLMRRMIPVCSEKGSRARQSKRTHQLDVTLDDEAVGSYSTKVKGGLSDRYGGLFGATHKPFVYSTMCIRAGQFVNVGKHNIVSGS